MSETTKTSEDTETSPFDDYLGPNYPYHKNISTPEEMKMSPKGDLTSLATNVVGLINYGSLLMTGDTIANKKIKNEMGNLGSQQPLGDRIFIKTVGECYPSNRDGKYIDPSSNDYKILENQDKPIKTDRYVLVDHIPTGNIPGLGNLSAMKGFIPGLMDNIFKMDPTKIFTAMTAEAIPKCYNLNFQTITYDEDKDTSNQHVVEYKDRWVSIEDLKDLNPCTFKPGKKDVKGGPKNGSAEINGVAQNKHVGGGKYINPLDELENPVSCNWIESSKDGFANLFKMKNSEVKKSIINVKNKPIAKIYNFSFGLLLTYLLFKVLKKEL